MAGYLPSFLFKDLEPIEQGPILVRHFIMLTIVQKMKIFNEHYKRFHINVSEEQ